VQGTHPHRKHAIGPSGDDAMNRIPQAQPGIALLECPWDPLKKEGIEGHGERVGKRERERERVEDPHGYVVYTFIASMQSVRQR
jgi:hypothetical protein